MQDLDGEHSTFSGSPSRKVDTNTLSRCGTGTRSTPVLSLDSGTSAPLEASSAPSSAYVLLPLPLPNPAQASSQVFLIVVALEAFRRLSREYDASIRKAYYASETLAVKALGKDEVVRPFRWVYSRFL